MNIKNQNNTLINYIIGDEIKFIYKKPLANFQTFFCIESVNSIEFHLHKNKFFEQLKQLKTKQKKFKSIYFNRFKYVGKGFKMTYKKKSFLNCVFGHSHIY